MPNHNAISDHIMPDHLASSRKFAVAPMMAWTDRHFRYLFRLISKSSLLYTEMLHHDAVINGNLDRMLGFDPAEHPLVCQLGGSDPVKLGKAVKKIVAAGYDEVNLNCGCPSDRVQAGNFGAALMADSDLVLSLMKAMQDASGGHIPVSIKHRIGIAQSVQASKQQAYADYYAPLRDFVGTLADQNMHHFIIHARIAILSGLSPKENRAVPPLDYALVQRIKQDFPDLHITLNGGIDSVDHAVSLIHGGTVDGVMVGRAAYKRPLDFLMLDHALFNAPNSVQTPHQRAHAIIHQMADYCDVQMVQNTRFKDIAQHMLGLYAGWQGASAWRRGLSQLITDSNHAPQMAVTQMRHLADEIYHYQNEKNQHLKAAA